MTTLIWKYQVLGTVWNQSNKYTNGQTINYKFKTKTQNIYCIKRTYIKKKIMFIANITLQKRISEIR